MEMALYMWFYDNFHIVDLQWDSKVTWFLCVLAVDLAFYVWHRAAHGQ
jgi:alkylglycerol monooxygenase